MGWNGRRRWLRRIGGGIALAAAGCGSSGAVREQAPVAQPGPDRVARVGELVVLDGSRSVDPEGGALAFAWTQTDGPLLAALSDAKSSRPTFTPSVPGTYVFDLVVSDGSGASPASGTTVVVVDDGGTTPRRPPAAEPRAPLLQVLVTFEPPPAGFVAPPRLVHVDGGEVEAVVVDVASDPTDDPAPGQVAGTVRVDVEWDGAVWARLYFPWGPGDDDPAFVAFDAATRVPVVLYGVVGQPFVLDGSRSHDDGVVRTFTWTQVEGPFHFTTEDPSVGVVPVAPGVYAFELRVTDDVGLASFARRLVVPVIPAGSPAAGPPVARVLAGTGIGDGDGVVFTGEAGTALTLDGTSSRSRNGGALTYAWEQVSGPPATLTGASSPTPTFVPPVPGAYVFQLFVTDAAGGSDARDVAISVTTAGRVAPLAAVAPVGDAALGVTGGGVVIVLDGLASRGTAPLEHFWTQVRGEPFAADAAGPGRATVAIDRPGLYEFELRVADALSFSPPARVSFRVE